MSRGGEQRTEPQQLQALLAELHKQDCHLSDEHLEAILSYGPRVVPYLEDILREAIAQSSHLDLKNPQRDRDWFVAIHALYLLAELRSEASLELVLEFLAQKQDVLDYWLHELLDEDVWEVVYFLGQNRLDVLERFVLNRDNNVFSRLAVCTALVQIGLHLPNRIDGVAAALEKVLALEDEDADFMGLVVSEVLDLKHEALKPHLLACIARNEVWSGIITPEEVEWSYQKPLVRKLEPLGIFARYKLFRQYTNFTAPSRAELAKNVRRHQLPDFI